MMDTQYLSLSELESFDSRSPQRGRERRFLCPVCGQHKPRDAAHRSLAVNTENGSFICHRCQTKGRLKEFWEARPPMAKKQKTRLKLMSHFALRESEFVPEEKKQEPAKTENLAEKMKKYRAEFLHSPAEIYLAGRGIPTDAAIRAGCGYAGAWEHWEKSGEKWILKGTDRRVVFPVFDREGNLAAMHGRAIDGNHLNSAKLTRGDKSLGLFYSQAEALDGKIAAICEGACDALALAACGIPAVSMTGTTPPDWFYKKMAFRRVLIATDADEAGDKAAAKLRIELSARGAKVIRLRPKSGKDWGEVLEAVGAENLSRYLAAFKKDLSDEARMAEAVRLFDADRREAALFAAEMIGDANLRETVLYQMRQYSDLKLCA